MLKPLDTYRSPNFDDRHKGAKVKYLIYHYTEGSLADSLEWLTSVNPNGQKVSAHYLISEPGTIYSLVPEEKRAWHAGKSSWEGDEGLNSTSIGIELVNNGSEPYRQIQMAVLALLSKDIMARHGIHPCHVLGHSDVAPGRKKDPGPHFDWKWLAGQNVGLYPEVTGEIDSTIMEIQRKLLSFGYQIDLTGEWDQQTEQVLGAFHMHFGEGDLGLVSAKLDWLLKKKAARG